MTPLAAGCRARRPRTGPPAPPIVTGCVSAEWGPHRAMWLGFPSDGGLWKDHLEPAQAEVAALARALAGPGGERVRLLASGQVALEAAHRLLGSTCGIEIVPFAFGDVWLRDTAPIFTGPGQGAGFRFNGWGGRYRLDGDDSVARRLARLSGAQLTAHDLVLEGGALEHDGGGTALTTRQCLTNPNRNADWSEDDAGRALGLALGVRKVLWLGNGLLNDHTDGHVDNLARFAAPGVVLAPEAFGRDDPNQAVYAAARADLSQMRDAAGRRLDLIPLPSPGRILSGWGDVAPASHMNFVIANRAVIVPIYDDRSGAQAIGVLKHAFPGRAVVGIPSSALLTGGGSFHCITQQEPGPHVDRAIAGAAADAP